MGNQLQTVSTCCGPCHAETKHFQGFAADMDDKNDLDKSRSNDIVDGKVSWSCPYIIMYPRQFAHTPTAQPERKHTGFPQRKQFLLAYNFLVSRAASCGKWHGLDAALCRLVVEQELRVRKQSESLHVQEHDADRLFRAVRCDTYTCQTGRAQQGRGEHAV
jgi:hypothetical protein